MRETARLDIFGTSTVSVGVEVAKQPPSPPRILPRYTAREYPLKDRCCTPRNELYQRAPYIKTLRYRGIIIMDAAFVPSELVVKHYVSHKFTLELGESITSLGKPIRNLVIAVAVIYCVRDLVSASVQAVLKRNSRDTRAE
jgi:hypothetical protein